MPQVPLNSGFLAAKFIALAADHDMYMLAWDTEANRTAFSESYHLSASTTRRIRLGVYNMSGAVKNVMSLFLLLLRNVGVRKLLLKDAASIKDILYYLPLFKLQPDIIHFEFGTLAKDIAMIKSLTKAKIVVSFRGFDINYAGLQTPSFYSNVWKYADALHFLGKDLRRRAMLRGYNAGKIEVMIPPAIDISLFAPEDRRTGNEILKIISVGRLVWKKGYEYAIRAVAVLKKRGIPFEYTIVGAGDYEQALRFYISELGLERDVKLTGEYAPQDIKLELAKAHVFLHPAVSEGFCNAVLEAQAMGLPAVVTDADGLTENIEDSITGFLVPKWDINAMADKLQWCYENPEQAAQMGRSGVERIKTYFRQEDQIRRFADLYKKVMQDND